MNQWIHISFVKVCKRNWPGSFFQVALKMRAMNCKMPVAQLELRNLCIDEYEQFVCCWLLCDLTSVRSVIHVSAVWYQASSMKCHSVYNAKTGCRNNQYTCFLEFDGDMRCSRPCHKTSHCWLWSWNLCDNTSGHHSSQWTCIASNMWHISFL